MNVLIKTHACLNYFPSGFRNHFIVAITNKMEETDLTMWSSKTGKNQRTLTIGLGGDICISMADMLMYSRNQHDIVKQLSPN